MTVKLQRYETYQAEEVLELYSSVGWTNYTQDPLMLQEAFNHSLKILAAYDGEQLVGVIRVVGDGFSVIFVQDLLVHPAYQRRGLGRQLLSAILTDYAAVYQLHLMTDDTEKTKLFYEALGFQAVDLLGIRAFTLVRP